MEIGDPPGPVTLEMVKTARARGIITGSCSDRPMSAQRALWEEYGVEYDFVCYKHQKHNILGHRVTARTLIFNFLYSMDLTNIFRSAFIAVIQ